MLIATFAIGFEAKSRKTTTSLLLDDVNEDVRLLLRGYCNQQGKATR